ncbi:hypothetical protein HRbin11_02123 [bacterium HR11]|nr:hypothetical protein HRbin11_02123 [bacterium HR11]
MTGIRRVGGGWPDIGWGRDTGSASEYTVRPGDTLSGIARRFGVSVRDLLKSNPHIQDPDHIFPGQVLWIPVRRDPSSAAPSPMSARDTYERATGSKLFGTWPPPSTALRSGTDDVSPACTRDWFKDWLLKEPVPGTIYPPNADVLPNLYAMVGFDEAVNFVFGVEGGYSNKRSDPGGPTNLGITQKTYDAWRKEHGMNPQDIKLITKEEALAIYQEKYWKAAHCDSLPTPLNVVIFDLAVNSGVGRAIQFLQKALGVPVTGRWDRQTQEAVERLKEQGGVRAVVERVLQLRERFFYQRVCERPDQIKFLRGWLNRLARLREYCEQFWAQSCR